MHKGMKHATRFALQCPHHITYHNSDDTDHESHILCYLTLPGCGASHIQRCHSITLHRYVIVLDAMLSWDVILLCLVTFTTLHVKKVNFREITWFLWSHTAPKSYCWNSMTANCLKAGGGLETPSPVSFIALGKMPELLEPQSPYHQRGLLCV